MAQGQNNKLSLNDLLNKNKPKDSFLIYLPLLNKTKNITQNMSVTLLHLVKYVPGENTYNAQNMHRFYKQRSNTVNHKGQIKYIE